VPLKEVKRTAHISRTKPQNRPSALVPSEMLRRVLFVAAAVAAAEVLLDGVWGKTGFYV
jgi:hypothetical protein